VVDFNQVGVLDLHSLLIVILDFSIHKFRRQSFPEDLFFLVFSALPEIYLAEGFVTKGFYSKLVALLDLK
jgi:hypothetical protein